MKNVSLFYKEGNSDKEYHIQLQKVGDKYLVNFQYGRVGNALQAGTKTPTPTSLDEATKIYDKLEREKRAKGYDEGLTKNDFSEQVIRSERKEIIILPQLLNAIEDVEEYINDDNYLAQEKMDGERRMLISNDSIIGLNKKGQEVPLPNSIIESVTKTCIIDGEIIGDKLYLFDLLSLDGKDLRNLNCIERLEYTDSLSFGDGIELVYTASSTFEKRALYEKLKRENKEGIVFKKKNAPYTAGRPASGGNQLKFKFQKTATFIVKNFTKGKRSVGLELISGESRIFMGKVTIPPNHEIPQLGDLIEVRYLYAYRNGAVFQPVYLGKRHDCDITDATLSQIIYKENN
jgi:bifunctional non-homologous end joining protein LigD